MIVRDAAPGDLPAIVAIYNREIETGVATFDLAPYAVEDRRDWFAQFGAEHPLLVCEAPEAPARVAGFAYYLPYRAKAGYARTKETTIYVDPDFRRRGVGRALYGELFRRARAAGVHVLVAVLGGENRASEALHLACGFAFVGRYPEVGYKFGGWVNAYSYVRVMEENAE